MEIKYKNTLEDFVNFTWFLEKPLTLIVFYGFQIVLFMLIASVLNQDTSLSSRMIVVIGFIIIWIIWIAFYNKIEKKLLIKRLKRQTSKDPSLLNERALIINEDTITIKSTKEIKEFGFEVIFKIHEEDNCIYIVSNKHKCIAIIPTDIFASIGEKEKLITQLKANLKRKEIDK